MNNPKELNVGNISVKRGEKKEGVLATYEMRDGSPVSIPVLVINGAEEGPIFGTICGQHANEPLGTMAIIDTYKMLDPSELSGALIAAPMITPTAFQHGWRFNPLDLDTAKFPGDPKGSISARMGAAVFKEVYEPSEVFINWHSNFIPCLAWVAGAATDDEDINIRSYKISMASGMTVVGPPGVFEFPPEPRPGRPVLPPKVRFTIEPEGSNTMERRNMRAARKTLLNSIKAAGIVKGKLEDVSEDCFVLRAAEGKGFKGYLPPELGVPGNLIRAERGGIVVKEADDAFIGRLIPKGSVIARIYSLSGEEREVIKAPTDGYIWGWPLRTVYGLQTPAVYTGAEICYWFIETEMREPYKSMKL